MKQKNYLLKLWMLLLCVVAGVGNAVAEEETIASFSNSSNEGWTINGSPSYSNSGGYQLVASTMSIVTPDIDWSGYNNIKIKIKARKYGGPNNNQLVIYVSQGETDLTTFSPTSTSLSYYGPTSISPSSGAITICCKNASNTKGSGVSEIIITGEKASGSGGNQAVATTVTIDDSGITNTNVFEGTAAGTFSATVSTSAGTINGATVTWSSSNTSVATINENTGAVTLVDEGTTTITANYAGIEDEYEPSSATYELTVTNTDPSLVTTYEKVTDASTLAEGDQILLVYEDGSLALGNINSGGKYYDGSSVTIENSTISISNEAVAVLTLGGDAYGWTIKSSLDNNYLSLPSSSNELRQSDTATEDNQKWTITIDEGVASVTNVAYNTRVIKYNSGSPRFACYTSGQKSLAIYRLAENLEETTITISPSENFDLNYGQTKVLTVTASNGATVTATSSDETVATVAKTDDAFTVTAVNGTTEGLTATITFTTEKTATHKAGRATIFVTVKDTRATLDLSFSPNSVEVEKGKTVEAPTLNGNLGNGRVTYTSSNINVATVDAVTGVVTGVAAGEATITATVAPTSEYFGNTATFTVTVTNPKHTATFSINGTTTTQDFVEGEAITFPENLTDIEGKVFVGWVTTAITGTTDTAPELVTSATMGENDVTYYAVFALASQGGLTSIVDNLTNELTGVTSTNYTEWSGKTSSSDAVYAGQSTKSSDDYIQLRTKDSNSGIVTTASGGKLKKVSITWGTGNTNTRSLQVYGKNSAYSNAADLYKSSTQGTLLGSLAVNGTTELSIDDDYTYVGLRSADGALYISQIDITWESGAGVSYSDYCTTVVAAAVERPVITLADNPFYFSTTATITCATEDASIKYSYDRENWSDYTSALTITETKTIYAKAVKGNDESAVVQVTATKNLAEPTVTIDATGITNTNVFEGTAAGSLSASVKYNETAIDDATVTWSGNNDAVAIINASTGAVTLVGAGSVTFTATYAGNGDYSEKSATYELTVTNTDPNANDGSAEKPYTVAEAIAYINTLGSSTSANDVYVSGIISKVDSYNSTYHSITYWISDDGTTTNQLEVYSGKGLENADFSSKDDLQVGDIVTVKGKVKMYSSTPEFDKNNYLVSLQHKPVITAEDVDIEYNDTGDGIIYNIANYVNGTMTTSTEADWIYGLNSTDDHFDTEHNEGIAYFSATENTSSESRSATITLTFTYGDNKTVTKDVIVTQAGYDPTPSIVFDGIETYSYETSSLAGNTNVHFVAKNINTEELTLVLCDVDGNEANYDWFRGDIYADYYAKLYWDANTDTENARTAYFKVKAGNTESPIFAVTQAKFVADYATLPFEFDGGRNAISTTSGLTQEGLGTDYNSSPYLKFDGTDDYLILKINERPGTLTFDIKGNGFSDGTFTVQTSEDGTAYTDLKTYTELGETQNKSFDNLGENVRYIKWIYTEKVNGNVALGNIVLAKPDNSPRLSVEPAEAEPFTYEENGNLCAEQTFTVTGTNLTGDITVSVTGEFDLRGPTGGYGNSSLTLGSGEEFGVNINDNLQQGSYSGTLTIASEGATSITIPLTGTVTAPAPPTITVAQTTVSVDAAGGEGTIDVTYTKIETNLVDVQFYAADGTEVDATSYDWIAARFDQDKKLSYIVEENTGEARTAYLKVYGVDNNGGDDLIYSELITITQAAASSGDQFALFNGDLVEGDYIIYYGGYAMNTTVSNSRLQYEEVTPENNIITTDNASIVWHIAPSGEYWTIYNSDATAYAAATGTRNQAQMLSDGTDDKALWTVSGNETYEFINKKNAANNVNKNLRNNGTNGFACYSTQTGGALSLYKRASATVTLAASGYASYCCDKALDFSTNSKNDFRAWYVSNVTGTSVTFTEITGKVKAGEGIILYGTPGAKCSLPYTKNGEELTGNMLRGTLEPTEVTTEMVIDGQSYTLFGLSNGKFVKMKNGTVNANKAFLPIPTSQVPTGNNARLDIVFSEETDGISSMQNAGCIMHNEIYDLQGRRVETMKKGSLYIVNGKKVVF